MIMSLEKPKVLILGSGIAGLTTALKFSTHCQVTVVCKANKEEGATRYAQGGIASVWSQQDTFEDHKIDTLTAGHGLCNERIVDICVREAPERIRELIEWGVAFTRSSLGTGQSTTSDEFHEFKESFDLHREGGHGKRRILHADDLTGLAIESALLEQVSKNENIQVLENHIAIDLITEGKILPSFQKFEKQAGRKRLGGRCCGAFVLNIQNSQIKTMMADIVVLATGGAGKVYLYTSNPDTATGDGIAMAFRAGARIANMEFIQFHPTCLYHPNAKNFLITEALRGEGAVLRTLKGGLFVDILHPMGSLAPRDAIAKAIDLELKKSGEKHVLLDCRTISELDFKNKFPNILNTCLKFGINPLYESIPIVPAAHYVCGGVLVDEHSRTSIESLYAVGEVACTGLHGANRLASNSLLEAVVFSHRLVKHALQTIQTLPIQPLPRPQWNSGHAVAIEENIDIAAHWLELRSMMWNYVGIVRSDHRLERARRRVDLLKTEVHGYYWDFLLSKDLIELRNLITVAELIIQSAQIRKESRGLHFNVDYPGIDDAFFKEDTIL